MKSMRPAHKNSPSEAEGGALLAMAECFTTLSKWVAVSTTIVIALYWALYLATEVGSWFFLE